MEHSKRVSPTCLITFERNRYSVPASFANRRVSLACLSRTAGVVAEGQTVCAHDRIIERSHHKPGRVIYDWRHYLAVIQRKPGALRNGAPFTRCPKPSAACRITCCARKAVTGRWSISCLWFCTTMKTPFCVPWNWRWTLGVPTKTHVLNLLHRLIDRKQTDHPEVDPPEALALDTAPKGQRRSL